MVDQESIFLKEEGDNWFKRNLKEKKKSKDLVIENIKRLSLTPKKVLEIGCSSGDRLNDLASDYGSDCYGLDPSREAISYGKKKYNNISLVQGVAQKLPYQQKTFDLIILGFCLYVCSREKLFEIAAEVDRVLMNGGNLIILDFHSEYPYKNNYSHYKGVFSYKYNYSKMFLWNPSYKIMASQKYPHDFDSNFDLNQPDNIISVSTLFKSDSCWPLKK